MGRVYIQCFRQRYIGADNPQLGFDGQHFFFSDFHNPQNIGNNIFDGANIAETKSIWTGSQVVDNILNSRFPQKGTFSSDSVVGTPIVYKINPSQDFNEFCPALRPYQAQQLRFKISNSSVSDPELAHI